jgi:hypothetical protein
MLQDLKLAISAVNLTGAGTDLTIVLNGVPALYHGVLTNAGI